MSRAAGLARAASGTMVLILLSRLLGFVRERAVAEVFGRTWQTDAFRAAFHIPDLMYFLLVGGALSAAFIPVFSQYLATRDEEEAWRVASSFLNLVVGLLLLFAVLGMLFTPALAPLVAYRFTGQERELLIHLMRLMFPAVFLTALAGLGIGVQNAYQRFVFPMLGPIVYNLGIILGAYLLGPRIGIDGLAYGTVAGAFGNVLIQAPFVLRKARWRPILEWAHEGMREILRLMGPALIGLSVAQVNLIVSTNLASALSEGSITALNMANRLMQFPLGVFAMGISTVLFPSMSRLAALGRADALRDTFSRGLRIILFVTVPSAVGLAVLGEPLIRLLFQAGAFGARDTAATYEALLYYTPALIGLSGVQIVTRVFYSLHDTRTPVRVSLFALGTNTLLSLLFLHRTSMAHAGLALAYSITTLLNLGLYLLILRRRLRRIEGGRLARGTAASLAASGLMALAVWGVHGQVASRVDLATLSGRLVETLAPVAVGVVVYGLASLLLQGEETRSLLRLVRREKVTGAPEETG
ncbi:murein biosynthesis integral membrane protein MurJ [Limnochorda pilosa]|uniref:Probable lipid II flippase MurJ n=1 Tax=Limnochorda pilosa TaxID=1555112 RepID=A0A0K2SNB8_LIMPI|nr:murein biosynthesis integral membrane protein MurJ [Limnochorda pilosa]BAS28497.1 membrane protein [Limnochorda pilosa]